MTLLRSAAFNTVVFGATAVLYVALAPTLALSRALTRGWVRLWFRCVFRLQRAVLGLDFRFLGVEGLPDGPFIAASAHQSAWETIGFFAVLDDPVYVYKRELDRLPLFGAYARAFGMIPVDRSGGVPSVRAMLRAARAARDAGRPVVIFPGGTRLAPDEATEVRPGVGALYLHCGVPVVPVSLDTGRYWGRRSFVKRPGTMTVAFGEPIAPGLDGARFAELLAERIDAGNRRLLAA